MVSGVCLWGLFCAISQGIDFRQPLQHYTPYVLQHVNYILVNLHWAEREGVHSGTGCNISFEALLSKWEGLEQKRDTGIRKGVTKRTMTVLMIFFYGEGKMDLLHWWPWTTTSLMASKPRCPEVMASNTIWGGERRLITPLINYTLLQETPECGLGTGKVQLSLNSLCPLSQGGAAGATAAGHRHYFHNMSQLTSVMTCKC